MRFLSYNNHRVERVDTKRHRELEQERERRESRMKQLHFLIKDSVRKGLENPIFRLRERQYREELKTL